MRKTAITSILLAGLLLLAWRWLFPPPLSVLLLGGSKGHKTEQQAELLFAALADRSFVFEYTEDREALSRQRLQRYDVLAINTNQGEISTPQERALLEAVETGMGLVVIHAASHAFRNGSYYTELVGGRFDTHETGVFQARVIDANHPVMRDFEPFESWDETYVHKQLGKDLRVLMVRDHEGGYEPYTWVRRQGEGKIFYTALGHDERTWSKPGFQDLLARALDWAGGRTPDVSDIPLPEDYLSQPPPPPLAPQASMETMSLPEGFRVELFAAEPDVVNPLSMTFDERGRLWVIESLDYPNQVDDSSEGRDRIKILEDSDGDGRADTSTIFAQGLNIPTSLLHVNGGLLVAQAPQVLFLEDTDGDDMADRRTVVLDGFGRYDTHAVLNNLRYGFDGWVWATIGYSEGEVKVGERVHQIDAGVFRFRPDGSALEVLTPTGSNTWGLGFNESGDTFVSKANRLHHLHVAIPNRFYERVEGWDRVGRVAIEDHKAFHPITRHIRQVDAHGGYTAAAGKTVYTARGFPRHYWNRASFVTEPTGHLVHIDFSRPEGSSFVGRDGWNLLASSDPWSAPVETLVGPDGAVWVADWYNYIVRHNPTPPGFETGPGNAYVTDQRDRRHGRIYRIVHRDQRLDRAPTPDPASAPAEVLIEGLGHPNMFWRQQCQRLLVERGDQEVLDSLAELVGHQAMDDTGLTREAAHALWAMSGLGAFEPGQETYRPVLEAALVHPSAAVRRSALRVAPRDVQTRTHILDRALLEDDDPQVRLDALLALAEMPVSAPLVRKVSELLKRSQNANDRWIPDAVVSLVTPLPDPFFATLLTGELEEAVVQPVAAALQAVTGHWARQGAVDRVRSLLARLPRGHPAAAAAVLRGISRGWPEALPLPLSASLGDRLARLGRASRSGVQMDIIRIASRVPLNRWGPGIHGLVSTFRREQLATLDSPERSLEERQEAAGRLLSAGQATSEILQRILFSSDPKLVEGLLNTLSRTAPRSAGRTLIARWTSLPASSRSAAVKVLLRRQESMLDLLDAVEEGRVPPTDFSLEQRQLLMDSSDQEVSRRAALLFEEGAPDSDRSELVASRIGVAGQSGDPEVGRRVFQENCFRCHQLDGEGGEVGPSLTGIGARPRADILTDILHPNLSVEGNYRQMTVQMRNGVLYSGVMGASTETSFELIESDGTRYQIEREQVERRTRSQLSLMPEGFESLSDRELASLLDYLTQQRRFLPLPLRWVANIVTTRGIVTDRPTETARTLDQLESCCWVWGSQTVSGVPFEIIDPQGGRARNAILLFSRLGTLSREMPKQISLDVSGPVSALHLLSGVSGWGYPLGEKGTVSMLVRFHYADGQTEEVRLRNGIHFADYSRQVDVPESELAFQDGPLQMRYLSVHPGRSGPLQRIEFVKGQDDSAPLILAATLERTP